jgi:hypothetical protein
VVLGGVEVDVVGDLDRQVQGDVVHGVHRLGRHVPGHPLGDLAADGDPAVVALGHEGVQAGPGEDLVAEQHGQVDDGVAQPGADPGGRRPHREDAVGQVLHAEQRAGGHGHGGHRFSSGRGGHVVGPRPDQDQA